MTTRRRILVFCAVLLLAAAGGFYWSMTRPQLYQVIVSPDKRFRVVVYRKPIWPSTMPGQASDAPGTVSIYEVSSGRLLNEAPIDMVQMVNDLQWSPGHVSVPMVFDFKLPE